MRDAITAANTTTATNACAAGTGNDTIQFSVTGTIALASTLPTVIDSVLTINGPASPGITIDGGGAVQVMVASDATLNLDQLTIANGYSSSLFSPGGIGNFGTLTVTNSTFSSNSAPYGGIDNDGTLSVKSTILAGSSSGGNCGGTITDTGYNISDDSTADSVPLVVSTTQIRCSTRLASATTAARHRPSRCCQEVQRSTVFR